jgi:hypothetical protein
LVSSTWQSAAADNPSQKDQVLNDAAAMAAYVLQGLPQLEPAIMDKLFWPNVPNLTAVHLQEQVACSNRDQLSTSIQMALQPLRK